MFPLTLCTVKLVVILLNLVFVTSVNDDRQSKLTLEQALIRLQKSPPLTATDFLARLTDNFAVELSANSQIKYLSGPKHSPEAKVQMPLNALFREYATEDDTAKTIAIESNEINDKRWRTQAFSPIQLGDIPPSANCEPELRTVHVAPLVSSQSPGSSTFSKVSQSDLYFPHCIRLPVCAGCCPSERLRCTAIEVARENVSVLHLRYSARDHRFQLGRVARVQVERHGRCACQCITQAADCGPGQLYLANECRCDCPMTVKMACLKRQRVVSNLLARFLFWNSARCQCECKPSGGVWHCASGFWFDRTSCSCQRIYSKTRQNRDRTAITKSTKMAIK